MILSGPRIEQTLRIGPVLIEGVTSLREAARRARNLCLPDWLVREGVASGRLLRVLPG